MNVYITVLARKLLGCKKYAVYMIYSIYMNAMPTAFDALKWVINTIGIIAMVATLIGLTPARLSNGIY